MDDLGALLGNLSALLYIWMTRAEGGNKQTPTPIQAQPSQHQQHVLENVFSLVQAQSYQQTLFVYILE